MNTYKPDPGQPGMMLTFEFEPIRQWAFHKGILTNGNPNIQSLKFVEEVGELAKAVILQDKKLVADAIGDCAVVLTSIAHMHGLSIEQCINGAYDEIKDRTGQIINSNFVKDELKPGL